MKVLSVTVSILVVFWGSSRTKTTWAWSTITGTPNRKHTSCQNKITSLSTAAASSRRDVLKQWFCTAGTTAAALSLPSVCSADGDEPKRYTPDTLDVDNFLKMGQVNNPMGVSGQAGKSRPETGVVLREGSEVAREESSGNVLAELVVGDDTAVLVSFSSPWPLAKGTVFDVECRDGNTGDGAFLAVTGPTKGKSIQELSDTFFVEQLFSPTGRFSFYGTPTDIKVKKTSGSSPDYRIFELSFSNLSQSTGAEIPRNAMVAATIVSGTDRAILLVASTSSNRWRKKGAEEVLRNTVASFRAIEAPKGSLKLRKKERVNANA